MLRPPKAVAARRGQAMVLFALTMLLLTLMVLLTLGISSRVKEKMEVQQVADAAAYSTAVVTSRTINSMALLNRSHVAIMVALAGTQSLLSWSGTYRGVLNRLETNIIPVEIAVCAAAATYQPCVQTCTDLGTIINNISQEQNRVDGVWDALDEAAAQQSKNLQRGVSDLQNVMLESLTDDFLKDQGLMRRIVDKAAEGDPHAEWFVADQGWRITEGELAQVENDLFGTSPSPAFFMNPRNRSRELGVEAAHGSRGESFVADRDDTYTVQLMSKVTNGVGNAVAFGSNEGEGWFAAKAAGHSPYGPSPESASSEDHADYTVAIISACPAIVRANATGHVFSDHSGDSGDEHAWSGQNEDDATNRHTMGACTACPGIWTMFIDLNPMQVDPTFRWNHLYGQPKVVTALQRDYGVRTVPDPWALNFTFGLDDATAKRFDNRGQETSTSGTNIRSQTAVATALSYYHRPGAWREPPNFFNPFWRATLVSVGVDNQGHPNSAANPDRPSSSGQNLQNLLPGLPQGGPAAEAVRALADNGFQGWQ